MEEEEIIVVRPKKSKSKKKKKKVIVQDDSSSEEEEIQKPTKNNLNQNFQRTAQEQVKYDLQAERIQSAMRSLGFI